MNRWWPYVLWKRNSNVFNFLCDLTCLGENKVIPHNKWEQITLSYHSAKSAGNISCGGGRKTFLISHMIKNDHVIECHSSLWWQPLIIGKYCTLFDPYRFFESGDMRYLFCNVTSQDLMFKGTYDLLSMHASS